MRQRATQEGKSLACCSARGGGGDVKKSIGLHMLERCDTCSGANWGQFQWSSLLLWSLSWTGWKTSCFPHPEKRKGRRCGWEALRSLPDNLFKLDTAQTDSCIADRKFSFYMSHPSSASPGPHPYFSSTVCPFRFSNDGFNQSFVSLSPLPGLSVLFCIQNVNFDPPTNLSDGGRLCGLMQKHPSSHQTLRVWSQSIIKVLGSKILCRQTGAMVLRFIKIILMINGFSDQIISY